MSFLKSPLFKTTTLGFIFGSSIPILFTNFYLLPLRNYNDNQDLNLLKKVVNFLNWQVWKLEQNNNENDVVVDQFTNRRYLNTESYSDGLYWAGF